jgi:hypothetical protein
MVALQPRAWSRDTSSSLRGGFQNQFGLIPHPLDQLHITDRGQQKPAGVVEQLGSALMATQVPDQNIRIDQHQSKFRG